jgi:hypothetical protein
MVAKFGTNKYGLKLGAMTSVDENGYTYIVAVTLLLNEDHESFQLGFKEFKIAFGVRQNSL